MKILVYTKYERIGASSRLRTYQYLDKISNCQFVIKPLFSETYIKNLYSSRRFLKKLKLFFMIKNLNIIMKSYLKRYLSLNSLKNYDGIIIEKELFPFLSNLFYHKLYLSKKPYILDFDDAIFLKYKEQSSTKNKIIKLVKNSSLCTAGNSFLAKKLINFGGKNVQIFPTVVDIIKYKPKANNDIVTIGWIGTNSTIFYLYKIIHIINKLSEHKEFKLITIGAKVNQKLIGESLNYSFYEWSEDSEVDLLNKIDIGIMPLYNSEWEKGKCSYKLIQYMALEKAVVASKIGSNLDLINSKDIGYLCNTDEEWYSCLKILIDNKQLRTNIGKAARKRIKSHYSLQKWIRVYNNNLDKCFQ